MARAKVKSAVPPPSVVTVSGLSVLTTRKINVNDGNGCPPPSRTVPDRMWVGGVSWTFSVWFVVKLKLLLVIGFRPLPSVLRNLRFPVEDWPALLRSLRLVGDDVRTRARKQFAGVSDQKASLQ